MLDRGRIISFVLNSSVKMAVDNHYISPQSDAGSSTNRSGSIYVGQADRSTTSSSTYIAPPYEIGVGAVEEGESPQDVVKSYAEPMGITISMVSLLLQSLIMYAVQTDPQLNTDVMGRNFENYTQSVLDAVVAMPDPHLQAVHERTGSTIPNDEGLPRQYLRERPKVFDVDEGCGYENTLPVVTSQWSPVRVVVCAYKGKPTVHINEWIDKLPYDGVILSPHEFHALGYLYDSIADEVAFLDRLSREGGLNAGCLLPVPLHHV